MKGTHIRYFGHSSFGLTTPEGIKIIIDPYQNSLFKYWFKQKFPKIKADIVIITHDHFDHNAWKRIKGKPQVIKEPSVYREKDYNMQIIKGKHAQSKKYNFYQNNIAVIEINKIRFCHWGDNDANITKNLSSKLQKIDVLIVPVDESEHLLTLKEVEKVIKKLSPRIVIPMHYFNQELTTKSSTLKSIDNWLKKQKNNIRKISARGITISHGDLPKKKEIWIFERYKGT